MVMKKIKDYCKRYMYTVITIFVTSPIFFTWIDEVSDFVGSYPTSVAIILFIILMAISVILEESFKKNINIGGRVKNSILIFDDKVQSLRDIRSVLSGSSLDIVMVRDISDYRLVENFDIVIGDVYGVGNIAAKDSIPVLQAIKEKYPYKFVFAMTNGVIDSGWNTWIDGIIKKESRDKYPLEIKQKIEESLSLLRDTDKYWQTVEAKLSSKNESKSNIEYFKNQYYATLSRKSES